MSNGAEDYQQNNGTSSRSTTPPPTPQSSANIPAKMIEHFKENKVNVTMWFLRLLIIVFAISYILPVFGSQASVFNKVLLANAAVSALRLHQRVLTFTFSREFFARLFFEDSCHYLLYSLVFFNVQPTLLVLMPILCFAILHASSYSLKLLDIIGQNSWWGARFLISLVEFQAANILKAASFFEIFLMPLAVVWTFMGRAGLMTPIIYYHFLAMRYSSRRNHYSRYAFTELRKIAENLASCSPNPVGKIVRGGIAFVNRLAPERQPVQSQ